MEESQHILDPLPYHVELRDYLKSRERELWNWFASARAQADFTENLRMDLLKSTYRLDAESHPELYKGVKEATERLQLDIPVTVYQAQNSPQPNAALYFINQRKPRALHVVRKRAPPDSSFLAGGSDLEVEYTSNLSERCSLAGRNGSTAREAPNFESAVICNEGCVWPLTEALLNTTPFGRGSLFQARATSCSPGLF